MSKVSKYQDIKFWNFEIRNLVKNTVWLITSWDYICSAYMKAAGLASHVHGNQPSFIFLNLFMDRYCFLWQEWRCSHLTYSISLVWNILIPTGFFWNEKSSRNDHFSNSLKTSSYNYGLNITPNSKRKGLWFVVWNSPAHKL